MLKENYDGNNSVSVTDPEARKMHMKDDAIKFAYLLQTVVDVKTGLILMQRIVEFTYKGKDSIQVSFGNVWKKQNVIVTLKGKTYQVKVNSNGRGILKLTKSDVKKLKKNYKYQISVFKAYTGKVTVKFNGKNYNVKINRGIANFKVTQKMVKKIKKGKTVNYTVSYKSDKITKAVKWDYNPYFIFLDNLFLITI